MTKDCRCDCTNCVTGYHRECYYRPGCPLKHWPAFDFSRASLEQAAPGDVIELPANSTFSGSFDDDKKRT